MPRRASSGVNVGQMAAIAGAIIGFLVIALLLIKLIVGDLGGLTGSTQKGPKAAPLNLTTYRDSATSLRGNRYQIDGKIEEMLRFTDNGRLISFDASDGSISIPVPVKVPSNFSSVNMERGAPMSMVVRVDKDGTLVTESINQ